MDTFVASCIQRLRRGKVSPRMLLVYCLVLGSLFSLSPRLFDLSYGYIDPSFNYGVNEAAEQGLSFGKEFIATYGPLGYLVANYTPEHMGIVTGWLLLYVIALGIGVYVFCSHYIASPRRRWLAATVLLYALAVTNGGGSIEWNYLSVFLLYCFVYFKLSPRWRWGTLIGLSIIAATFSLTKFTLGVGSLGTLLILPLFASGLTPTLRLKQVAAALGTYLAVFFALGTLLGIGNLLLYMKTALLMSGGFSAMSAADPQTVTATVLVGVAIALILLWPVLDDRKRLWQYLFLVPALALIWKYSVIRQDGHLMMFIQVSLPVAAMLYFSRKRVNERNLFLGIAILLLTIVAVWANKLPFYDHGGFSRVLASPVANIVDGKFIDYFQMGEQRESWKNKSEVRLQPAILPEPMKKKIGTGTVDVFPWEAVIVEANGLRWNPRPSPYAFESYDPYFDDANAKHLTSRDGPDYIIWHNTAEKSVDFRHILWDEPKTFRTMLTHYDLVESDQGFMLLQKRDTPRTWRVVGSKEPSKHSGNTWIRIPGNTHSLVFIRFEVAESKRAKLEKLLVRQDPAYITVRDTHGVERTYRFVTENSGQGFLISDLPKDWNDLVTLMRDGGLPDEAVTQFAVNARTIEPIHLEVLSR